MRSEPGALIRVGVLAVLVSVAAPGPVSAQFGHLLGIVRDETGEPIQGAVVHITNAQGYLRNTPAKSDKDGHFSFLVPAARQWEFRVEAEGFASTSRSVTVGLGSSRPVVVEVTLERRETPELWGVLAGVNPRNISARLAAADALFAAGRYSEAIAAYRAVREQAPALSLIGLLTGNAYLRAREYDRAEAEFREVLRSSPGNARACYALGELETARELPDEAADWYQQAAAAAPRWARPLMRLAILARDAGNRETAVGYLKAVVALDPDSEDAGQALSLLEQLAG